MVSELFECYRGICVRTAMTGFLARSQDTTEPGAMPFSIGLPRLARVDVDFIDTGDPSSAELNRRTNIDDARGFLGHHVRQQHTAVMRRGGGRPFLVLEEPQIDHGQCGSGVLCDNDYAPDRRAAWG